MSTRRRARVAGRTSTTTKLPTKLPPLLGKLTQREFAKRTGLHYSYVSLVLRGKRRPSIDALSRMAKALGLTMGGLYEKLLDLEAARKIQEKRQKKGR